MRITMPALRSSGCVTWTHSYMVTNTRAGVSNTDVGVSNTRGGVTNTRAGVSNTDVRVSNTHMGVSNTDVGEERANADHHPRREFVGVRHLYIRTENRILGAIIVYQNRESYTREGGS